MRAVRFSGTGSKQARSGLAIALSALASAALLFGCSDDGDSGGNSSPNGGEAIVTGSAKCDQESIQEALSAWSKMNGTGKATLPDDEGSFRCADGWAVAFPNVGSGEAEVTVTAVFEAEGQFWISKDRSEVCGKNAKSAEVPASLYRDACQSN